MIQYRVPNDFPAFLLCRCLLDFFDRNYSLESDKEWTEVELRPAEDCRLRGLGCT